MRVCVISPAWCTCSYLCDVHACRYQLKSMAQALMATDDPRIPESILGIGPAWQYIANASDYERRGRVAYPLAEAK